MVKIAIRFNITAILAVMLFSCGNPDSVISELSSEDTLSGIIADSVVFYRSDSGIVKVELITPRMVTMESDNPFLEFPLGFVAHFFDGNHNKTTDFQADYGKSYSNGGLIEAWGNVKIENYDRQQVLYADKLYWYQDTKMIHTRSHVKIVTPDREVEADSLVAMEDFSEYTLYSGKALLDVDEEEL